MKKIIGIFSIIVLAIALSFNANPETNMDMSLASLIVMNTANAEDEDGCNGNYTRSVRNYNITSTPEDQFEYYDEDDCEKQWCEYYTLSGWCCFYD